MQCISCVYMMSDVCLQRAQHRRAKSVHSERVGGAHLIKNRALEACVLRAKWRATLPPRRRGSMCRRRPPPPSLESSPYVSFASFVPPFESFFQYSSTASPAIIARLAALLLLPLRGRTWWLARRNGHGVTQVQRQSPWAASEPFEGCVCPQGEGGSGGRLGLARPHRGIGPLSSQKPVRTGERGGRGGSVV